MGRRIVAVFELLLMVSLFALFAALIITTNTNDANHWRRNWGSGYRLRRGCRPFCQEKGVMSHAEKTDHI